MATPGSTVSGSEAEVGPSENHWLKDSVSGAGQSSQKETFTLDDPKLYSFVQATYMYLLC